MLACASGTIQAVVIGIMIDRDPSSWALSWDLQLLTVVYSVINFFRKGEVIPGLCIN